MATIAMWLCVMCAERDALDQHSAAPGTRDGPGPACGGSGWSGL